jgi:hypothetical protein
MAPTEIQERLIEVNVDLDWQRAFAEQWPICIIEFHQPQQIRALNVAWYCGDNGPLPDIVEINGQRQHACSVPQARPVTVGDVADHLDTWTIEKRRRIQQYAFAFQAFANPISIILVAYALPGKRFLLLDGNHRAVAAVLSGKEITATLVVICGPCDPAALPDLTHWTENSK